MQEFSQYAFYMQPRTHIILDQVGHIYLRLTRRPKVCAAVLPGSAAALYGGPQRTTGQDLQKASPFWVLGSRLRGP